MPLRLGMIYALQRKFDLALDEFDKALAINPKDWWASFNKGDVYFYQDNFKEALRTYQDVLESAPNSAKHLIHLSIVALYEGQGKFKKAFEHYENLFDQAVSYIEMGNLDKAEENLEEIRRLTPEIMRRIIQTQSYYSYVNEFYLKGRMALKRKNYPEAVKNLEKAVSALGGENYLIKSVHALYMDSLASAYTENEDIDQAIKTYEKISLLTCGRFFWGDIYAQSFYRLGKIREQKGEKEMAIANYERFLELWKDADPGFTEVEDARHRLDKLKTS